MEPELVNSRNSGFLTEAMCTLGGLYWYSIGIIYQQNAPGVGTAALAKLPTLPAKFIKFIKCIGKSIKFSRT